ncbi:MAG: hypothetical protein U1F83_09435 [Verrucomicrobiota bacterium]
MPPRSSASHLAPPSPCARAARIARLTWLVLGLLGSSLLVGFLQADEEEAKPNNPTDVTTIVAWVENGEFIGEEQIRRLYVNAGSNHLGFIVPTGLRVDVSRPERVTLTAPDLSFFLTLRILGSTLPAGGGSPDTFRQQTMQHYPGAVLSDESTAEVAGRRGPVFNLRWKPAEGLDRVVIVAFIPNAAGVLEFSIVAERGKAAEAQNALSGLLQRFQSTEGARLRMETFRQPEYN